MLDGDAHSALRRRIVFAVLTEKGAALRKQMWAHYRNAILEVFGAAVSTREAEMLIATLKKIIGHLRKQHLTGLRADNRR
jgi:DNA-binding MarR family transcriptional regulator